MRADSRAGKALSIGQITELESEVRGPAHAAVMMGEDVVLCYHHGTIGQDAGCLAQGRSHEGSRSHARGMLARWRRVLLLCCPLEQEITTIPRKLG